MTLSRSCFAWVDASAPHDCSEPHEIGAGPSHGKPSSRSIGAKLTRLAGYPYFFVKRIGRRLATGCWPAPDDLVVNIAILIDGTLPPVFPAANRCGHGIEMP